MVINEKDFGMYVDGVSQDNQEDVQAPTNVPEIAPEVAPEVAPKAPADVPEAPMDELEKLAAEVPADPAVDTATPPVDAPVEEGTDLPIEEDNISGDELQRMLDALDEGAQAGAETTQEIKTAAEDIQKSLPEGEGESQKKVSDLIVKVAELEANDIKNKKTIEVFKSEYDKLLNDKLALEYGSANDSKIATMINDDADMKSIVTAKVLMEKGGDKEALIQAYKVGLENLTGQSFDTIMNSTKDLETNALSSGEDAGMEVPTADAGEKIYV